MDEMRIESSLLNLLITPPDMEAAVTSPFSTEARCFMNADGEPEGTGAKPQGEVTYGSQVLFIDRSTTTDISTVDNGVTEEFSRRALGLLTAPSYTEVQITPRWGWDEQNLRAYSEVTVSYRGTIPTVNYESNWTTHTVRSECGMHLSDGRGATTPAGTSATAAAPQALRLVEPEGGPTSAPGAPREAGFTTEGSLSAENGAEYHLLSTRELDLLDRQAVAEALAATRETGNVEGETASTRWSLYSAEAAGEQVPVLEVELADGAIVQVRPDLPGAQLPEPDASEVTPEPSPVPTESQSTPPEEPEPTVTAETEPTAETPTTTTTGAAGDE